jgi:hypothetical protein
MTATIAMTVAIDHAQTVIDRRHRHAIVIHVRDRSPISDR